MQRTLDVIPVKVCALDFDIAHAIARLALTLLSGFLFLLDTHGGYTLRIVEWWKSEERRVQVANKRATFFERRELTWVGPSGLGIDNFEAGATTPPLQAPPQAPPHRSPSPNSLAMPPRIPVRASWTSNSPSAPSGAWTSTRTPCMRRALSSTPASLALGPQSPNYIDVPKPLQPSYPVKPDVKGHLPIPRDIFKTRNKHPKESDVFIARSTREPKEVKAPGPYSKDAEYRLYKQRLAEKRREALKEGVKELHERKVTSEAEYMAKIQAIGATRRALAMAPRREVDILTETSVAKGIRDFLGDSLPPRQDISKARSRAYQRRIARVQQVRASRLHDLYTNAREFIVDEQQLDEAIEKAFGTEEEPVGWDRKGSMGLRHDGHDGLSPWHGPMPEGVGEMLKKLKGGEGVGLAKERVKKVAEELTGGKM